MDASRLSELKEPLSLDDVALFLAVAEAGGLAGAARATGVSQPTLSRKMARLERQLGRRLFLRGPQGYALTGGGRELVEQAAALLPLTRRLRDWGQECVAAPWVKITAGVWTSRFLVQNIGRFWSPAAPFVPNFLSSNQNVDIARREADIGIRNRRPVQDWLAGRRTGTVRYAEYAASPEVQGYIGLPEAQSDVPSQRWLRAEHGDHVVTEASDPRLMLDLALAAVGRVVVPCFTGDAEAGLVRVSDPIPALDSEEWLVCHHEARHDPPVRAALDAIHALLVDPGRGTV